MQKRVEDKCVAPIPEWMALDFHGGADRSLGHALLFKLRNYLDKYVHM
jgi:hypothetical protein